MTLDQVQQQQRRLYGKDNALRTASGYLMECSTNGNFAATSRCKAHCTASTISNGIGVGLATIAPAEKAMRRQELFARSLQGIATPGEVVRDTGYREGKHGQGRAAGYREGKQKQFKCHREVKPLRYPQAVLRLNFLHRCVVPRKVFGAGNFDSFSGVNFSPPACGAQERFNFGNGFKAFLSVG